MCSIIKINKKASINIYIILILLSIILFSCEKVIDTTIPERDKKIVLNSLISPDSLIWVNLSKSTGVLENSQVSLINNGMVKLYQSGNFVEELFNTSYGNYYSENFYPIFGKTYEIRVEVENMPSVSAECIIPEPVQISSWDTVSQVTEWGEEVMIGSILFKDPTEISNYYWFTTTYSQISVQIDSLRNIVTDSLGKPVLEADEGTFWINLSDRNTSINFEDAVNYMNGIFFSDRIMDGNDIKLDFTLQTNMRNDNFVIWMKLYLELHSVTKDFFLYAKSFEKHSGQGPFSEPSQVFNNIENGFGIFAGYSTSRDSIMLVDLIGNQ